MKSFKCITFTAIYSLILTNQLAHGTEESIIEMHRTTGTQIEIFIQEKNETISRVRDTLSSDVIKEFRIEINRKNRIGDSYILPEHDEEIYIRMLEEILPRTISKVLTTPQEHQHD